MIALDTETTGLDLATAKIAQIAIVGVDKEFQYLEPVNPGCPIPKDASDIHGITDEMVKDSPVWGEIWAKVAWAFEPTVRRDCEVAYEPIIGYNLRTYDIPLIARECANIGILFQPGPIVDVHDLVCWHLRGLRKRTLGAACEHFGISHGKAHDALADALAAIQVLKAMQTAGLVPTRLPGLLVHSARIAVLIDAEWDKWEYYLYQRDSVVRVGFGKEIGRAISEVSAGWLGWALGELRAPAAVRDVWRMELLRRHSATAETFQSIPT